MDRRLAAIVAADVVGYSAHIRKDETGTLLSLRNLRETLIDPSASRFRGRMFKVMGDGFLFEFASAVDAVGFSISVQQGLSKPAENPNCFQFRFGINLGDVIIDGDDVYGDGVNVAARLESFSKPEGICIADAVYEQVRDRLDVEFDDLGDQQLKNINRPIRIWSWPAGSPKDSKPAEQPTGFNPHHDNASIAVLPFDNLSGSSQEDTFADGICEDIITGLSRFKTLFVLAKNTSFSVRGQNLSSTEVGQKLGVTYLVEGSVRKAGNRVRISARLIEAEEGKQLWADRYDADFSDIFTVQDEVTRSIVAVLPGRIQSNVARRVAKKPTYSMKAYEFVLRGKALRDGLNATDTLTARELYKKAIDLDPTYARAYMYLSDTYVVDSWLGLADGQAAQVALELARKGAALDNNDVFIQDQLGYAYLCAGLYDEADAQFEKTVSKIVNEAESMAWCGYGFLLLGRHERANEIIQNAKRLDPLHPPALDWMWGQVLFFEKQFAEATQVLNGEALLNSLAHAFLVSAYAHDGRLDESKHALQRFRTCREAELSCRGLSAQNSTLDVLVSGFEGMWRDKKNWKLLAGGLIKAGQVK